MFIIYEFAVMRHSQDSATTEEIHETILNVAEKRLLRFGFHKTTMAEIADDAGMSAANLYRYFGSKNDIIEECASRSLDRRLDRLRLVAQDPKSTPSEKLAKYALELVEDSHALVTEDSMVGELIDTITRERPNLLHTKNSIHCGLIASILRAGVESGEYNVGDIDETARHIHAAFTLFDLPIFVGLYERSEFDQRATGITTLIVNGLSAK